MSFLGGSLSQVTGVVCEVRGRVNPYSRLVKVYLLSVSLTSLISDLLVSRATWATNVRQNCVISCS